MDQGRPLERSPPGPWSRHVQSKAAALPVLQTHCKMAFRITSNRLDASANVSAEVQQSAAILPLQYDSVLSLVDLARHAPQDPLSMCIPLFAHAAFSELQFLNLMDSKIQVQVNAVSESVPVNAVESFQFFFNILQRHLKHVKESMKALYRLSERCGQDLGAGRTEFAGTRCTVPSITIGLGRRESSDTSTSRNAGITGYDGTFTARGLMEDYEDLQARCVELSQMCTRGITLAMNKAAIDESRKAIEQSQRMKKLTLLATIFIPLNFCSSLFGMNLDILGQSRVNFWWFFVLCIPIIMLTYVFYRWEWIDFRQLFARARRRNVHSGGQHGASQKSERDPNHVV